MNVSIVRCEFLATMFRVVLNLCLSQMLSPSELNSVICGIPLDIQRIFDVLNLHPHTQSFICCPECYKLYPDSLDSPDRCTYQPTLDSEMCNTLLYKRRVTRGISKTYPTRKFLYNDMKAWMANMLSRPDIEAHADRNVFANSQNHRTDLELRDIWDGKVFREFKGPDGKLFIQPGSQEGRYIFSLCMDGFNPFIMKEAGKKVSVCSIYMVLLNLPVGVRYRVENMYLVGIIPGPREPSLEQINHVLGPLVDDLLCFWEPGVFIKHTAHYAKGRLCHAALIPVVCDLPAARQISGFASHASTHFCSFCKLPLHDIDNLEANSWPVRTLTEHRQSASAWKSATSSAEQSKLYRQNGVRWSELLRLPYWDPTTFVVLDCMHSLLLGDLQRHCREVWGMDFHLEDDDFHVKPDGKRFFITQDELQNGEYILKHGSDKEVLALPYKVLHKLCSDTKTIRYSRKRKEQLVEQLLRHVSTTKSSYIRDCIIHLNASCLMLYSKRTTCGWPPPQERTVQNVANYHPEMPASPSRQMVASTNTPKNQAKPTGRRMKLATGTELQDGQVKYTSATSFSKIKLFRKGVIVALLLDLDIPPSPGSLDELWALNKSVLETMLWEMVRHWLN